MEHRAAAAPDPVFLRLVESEGQAYLEVVGGHGEEGSKTGRSTLTEAVLEALRATAALTREALRSRLSVKNERLGLHSAHRKDFSGGIQPGLTVRACRLARGRRGV
jgi:hypothetical protein